MTAPPDPASEPERAPSFMLRLAFWGMMAGLAVVSLVSLLLFNQWGTGLFYVGLWAFLYAGHLRRRISLGVLLPVILLALIVEGIQLRRTFAEKRRFETEIHDCLATSDRSVCMLAAVECAYRELHGEEVPETCPQVKLRSGSDRFR